MVGRSVTILLAGAAVSLFALEPLGLRDEEPPSLPLTCIDAGRG